MSDTVLLSSCEHQGQSLAWPYKGMGLGAQELGLHKFFLCYLECGQQLLWGGVCSPCLVAAVRGPHL